MSETEAHDVSPQGPQFERKPRLFVPPPDRGLQLTDARYVDSEQMNVIGTVLGRTVTLPVDDPLVVKHLAGGGRIDDPEPNL